MHDRKNHENPLITLLANVVLPVLILNKLSHLNPVSILLLALSFPLGYGLWSYWKSKKINYISVLGLVNTLFTGGFALLRLEGIWFAVKEAAFPFLIGLFVFISSFSQKPFMGLMLLDTGALNSEEIDRELQAKNLQPQFLRLLQKTTLLFSLSFLLSAILNFVLAFNIFESIPVELTEAARAEMLNAQIARMTWMGYAVIFVPSISIFFLTLYFFFRKLGQLTGLKLDQMLKS